MSQSVYKLKMNDHWHQNNYLAMIFYESNTYRGITTRRGILMEKHRCVKMQRSKRAWTGGEGGNVEYSPLTLKTHSYLFLRLLWPSMTAPTGFLVPALGGFGPWETPARRGRGEGWRHLVLSCWTVVLAEVICNYWKSQACWGSSLTTTLPLCPLRPRSASSATVGPFFNYAFVTSPFIKLPFKPTLLGMCTAFWDPDQA